jgi:hypothetical protein
MMYAEGVPIEGLYMQLVRLQVEYTVRTGLEVALRSTA